jgi:uncharacterized protein YjbJ (UPF0337 family)
MNKDQVKGRMEQAKGSIKETTGKAVGNKKLETEGQIDKTSGKAQATYGDLKEDVKDAVKDAKAHGSDPDPIPTRR